MSEFTQEQHAASYISRVLDLGIRWRRREMAIRARGCAQGRDEGAVELMCEAESGEERGQVWGSERFPGRGGHGCMYR